jgi:hypothetical protein
VLVTQTTPGWTRRNPKDLSSLQAVKDVVVSVSKHDRDEYEEGLRDRDKGVLEQAFNDITVNHPDSEAYYKGRRGEQLDEDKDKD